LLGLLQGLLSVARKCKCDQAAVAVVFRPEPFEPQWASGNQCLQRGMAVIEE
jgi:hypothetical protein